MRRFSLLLLLAASGCTVINEYEDPLLVGDWKLKINERTKMSIDLEGDGKATLSDIVLTLTTGGMETGTMTYKLDWEQTKESEFEIKFKCSTTTFTIGCNGLDMRMECEPKKDGKELDCAAKNGPFFDANNPDNAKFDWEDD